MRWSWALAGGVLLLSLSVLATVLLSGDDAPSSNEDPRAAPPVGEARPPHVDEPAAGLMVDTPIGELRLLRRPVPADCDALASFPFDEIRGLDHSGWDDGDLGVTVHGLDPSTDSIDLSFSAYLGLYIIRDGALVANLRDGPHVDSPESRRRWDTWSALYTIRPDEDPGDPHPTLGVGGGDAGGGIRVSGTPSVANCSFNEGHDSGEPE